MFGWFFFSLFPRFPYEQKRSAFKIYSICTEAANRDSGVLYFMVL